MPKTNAELKAEAIELVGEVELSRRFNVWIKNLIKKELVRRSNMTSNEFFLNQANTIIDDLNERTGARFKLLPERLAAIQARMDDGNEMEDFRRVHEIKVRTWTGTDMEKYLTPDTLWRPSKFDNYLSEWYKWKAKRNAPIKGAATSEDFNAKGAMDAKEAQRAAEENELVAKLNCKAWFEFDGWYEFMMWTVQFPDEQSLKAYPMPDRIRAMRCEPGMLRKVAMKKGLDEADNVYKLLKAKQK